MAYGYEGDATPDSNSLAGIGDQDNQLSHTPEHQSVALTIEGRMERFGLSREEAQKSTGRSFEDNGRTYYDNDTAPTDFVYHGEHRHNSPDLIDVYDPTHPPDVPIHKQLGRAPSLLPKSAEVSSDSWLLPNDSEPAPSLSDSPEPQDEKPPKPPKDRPVDAIRKHYPEYAQLSDEEMVPKLQAIFPDVPKERLSVYATQPGGGDLIRQYQDRNLNPLDKFRKYYQEYVTGDDDKDLEWMRQHFQPDMGKDQFRALAKPPGPVLSFLGHLYEQATSGTVGALGAMEHPEKAFAPSVGPNPRALGMLSALQGFFGKGEQMPKAITDIANKADVFGWEKQASQWMEKNVAGYGAANNWFRDFVNGLAARGRQWEKQSAQAAGAIPKDSGSQFQGVMGELVGSAPDAAVSFGLGATGRAAALWGMLYEGVSAYGHAVENNQKNALLQGVTAAGFRGFAQYLLNTGKGRIVSGIANSFATVAQEEIDKWARGEPNDISKDGKAATVGLLTGLLLARQSPREAFLEAEPPEHTSIPPDVEDLSRTQVTAQSILGTTREDRMPWYSQPPVQVRPHIGSFTPEQMKQEVGRLPKSGTPEQMRSSAEGMGSRVVFNAPIQEEFSKAQKAHQNGDHDTAAQYIDRGFAFMPDKEKRELAQSFVEKVDELAGDGKKKTLSAEDKLFNDYYFAGLFGPFPFNLFKRKGEEREIPAINLGGKVFTGTTHSEAWEKAGQPESGFGYGWSGKKGYREDEQSSEVTDAFQKENFYSGLPLQSVGKGIKDWFENNRPGLPLFHAAPEETTLRGETAGAIVKGEEARSRAASNVGPSRIYRQALQRTGYKEPALNFFEKITGLRFGDPMERMDRFFHNFSKQELVQQFLDYQDKGAAGIKDPNARWNWENVLGPSYDAIEKRDAAYGIEYDHRDNYFYQLLTHPKRDLPRLKASIAKSGMGLTFTKPREMRLVERLALGHEMITTNPVRLMQMRWWGSERAIQKIRDIKQMEAQGFAFNTQLKGKNIPADRKAWIDPANIFGTADKQTYYVDPDVIPVLNAKFDYGDIFQSAAGPALKFVAALKGTVAAKVSWSLFHPLHILDITQADAATNALERVLAGRANWGDVGNLVMNEVPFAGSLPTATRAYVKYADAVNYLKGRLDFEQLTPDQQRDVRDFLDMGLVVDTSQEREMQFTKWLQENGPSWIRKGGPLVKMGLDVLGNPLGFNKWWFGTVTPRLKFASAMMRRDTLQATRPELFRDAKRMERLREYQKFHRDIEGRYGEMHYDNLLWPRMLKQTGTTFMLALGWQLGMFRTMGDGVVDLTRNAAHMREIIRGWKTRDPAARHLVTNRMVFTAIYLARGLAAGWAISYFIGGKKEPDMWDGVYPVIGKDAQGKDKRINMQYFYKDIPAFHEYQRMTGSTLGAILLMTSNKMQPMMMAVIQAAMNKDYMNHAIGDLPARGLYILQHGAEPISFENMQQPGQTFTDKLLTILGFSPSGRWTMRSDMENKIIADAVEARNFGPMIDARDRYRQAYLAHDQAAMQSAREELHKMDVTPQQIRNIEKTAKEPTAHRLFKQLRPEQQESRWKEMTPAEKREYWPLIKKELKSSGKVRITQ